jgi:hypothetical protein
MVYGACRGTRCTDAGRGLQRPTRGLSRPHRGSLRLSDRRNERGGSGQDARNVDRRESVGCFFLVEPETAGIPEPHGLRDGPAVVFDGWLEDELVRAYPLVLATSRMKNRLLAMDGATGFSFRRARVRTSPFFRRHHPGRRLPPFFSIDIAGIPGRDDMALTQDGTLVVSPRVLGVLLEFRVGRAVFAQYRPGESPCRPLRR